MCEYCKNKEKISEYIDKNKIYIDEGELNITTSSGDITYSVDINYCPMCGRKLKGE